MRESLAQSIGSDQVDSSTQRHLPLVDLLVDTRAELMELAVASGLEALTTMLEEDRTAIRGRRYQHQTERQQSAVSRRFVAKTASQPFQAEEGGGSRLFLERREDPFGLVGA